MSLSNTITSQATTSPAPSTPVRTRRFAGRQVADRDPAVTPIVIDGEPALSVETFGRHGGKPFIIDADRWPEVVESWGARWTVMTTGTGHFYVASARKQATQAATRRRAHCPLAYLARLLTSADEDEVVGFVNGNPFDMRVSNMELLTRAEVLWRHSNRLTA